MSAVEWPAWMVSRRFYERVVYERGERCGVTYGASVCFYEHGVMTEISEIGDSVEHALSRAIERVEHEHAPDSREPRLATFGRGPSDPPDLRPGDWIHIDDQRFCVVSIGDRRIDARGVRGGNVWLFRRPRGGWLLRRLGAWARPVRWIR